MAVYFISGIDTGIGKTAATAFLARDFQSEGRRVITAKLVQTGCQGVSEDLLYHRRLMGCGWLEEDREGLTCTQIFSYPTSPHLAAAMEGRKFSSDLALKSIQTLAERWEVVLVEGAGGLMVPLTDDLLTIDLLAETKWPVYLVTSPRLGSLNHTLLSLEVLQSRSIPLAGMVYNTYRATIDPIFHSTREYLTRHTPGVRWVNLPELE